MKKQIKKVCGGGAEVSVTESFLAPYSATHGYLAGEIEPGKWHLILGLASVADKGVEAKN